MKTCSGATLISLSMVMLQPSDLIESIQQVAPGINNPVTCDEEV
jgi:hypothetical protein